MMKKAAFWLAIAVMVMAAGCASTGVAEDTGLTEELAAQLAADINTIEAGKATVSGDIVTLSGRVELTTALTMPEGVTLDLTADGAALELQDGAVLTVNGMVNANSYRVRLADNARVTINGSGSIRLASKGQLLNIGSSRKLTLDGVTLVGLPDNDNSLVEVSEGGELVMKSGAITGNTFISEEYAGGGGAHVWKGMFIMTGGTITGNSTKGGKGATGGGVRVKGTFTMEGGEILGNTATSGTDMSWGGGVYIQGNSVFTMKDGTISGNIAASDRIGAGGGVAIGSSGVEGVEFGSGDVGAGTFAMEGGTISGNSATGKAASEGGGVHIRNKSIFTMKGGAISGNSVTGGNGGNGGGVNVERATFTMEGGTIYGSSAEDGNANTSPANAVLRVREESTAKWGTGGTYTKGGVSQSGGGNIGSTNDTLIAIPAQ